MARRRAEGRFSQLVEAATRIFIESGGFRRTQIQDVAKAMGVAKGTVYLYVESKEALFDLVVRYADRPIEHEPELPVKTPAPGATVAYLQKRLRNDATFVALEAAERRAAPRDSMQAELGAIVDELYDLLASNRNVIKLIGTSARELPELAELWYGQARGTLNQRLVRYFERRAAEGYLRPMPDAVAAARFVTETASWFSVHRFWDPHPDPIDDDVAKATVRTAILRSFLTAEH